MGPGRLLAGRTKVGPREWGKDTLAETVPPARGGYAGASHRGKWVVKFPGGIKGGAAPVFTHCSPLTISSLELDYRRLVG